MCWTYCFHLSVSFMQPCKLKVQFWKHRPNMKIIWKKEWQSKKMNWRKSSLLKYTTTYYDHNQQQHIIFCSFGGSRIACTHHSFIKACFYSRLRIISYSLTYRNNLFFRLMIKSNNFWGLKNFSWLKINTLKI